MTKAEIQKRWIASEVGQAYRGSEAFKESVREYRRTTERAYRKETQRKVRAIKMEKGCIKCGFNNHQAALEFHHRDPRDKKFRLSESRNYSWKAVEIEMAKCDVMCANCHAILEHEKRNKF